MSKWGVWQARGKIHEHCYAGEGETGEERRGEERRKGRERGVRGATGSMVRMAASVCTFS